jgi:hypothetical protein
VHPAAHNLPGAVHGSIPGAAVCMECEVIGAQSKTAQREGKTVRIC